MAVVNLKHQVKLFPDRDYIKEQHISLDNELNLTVENCKKLVGLADKAIQEGEKIKNHDLQP